MYNMVDLFIYFFKDAALFFLSSEAATIGEGLLRLEEMTSSGGGRQKAPLYNIHFRRDASTVSALSFC